MVSCDLLLSLNIELNNSLYRYTTFIHSLVDGHLGCFFLAVRNNAAMNIFVQVLLWMHVLISPHHLTFLLTT